MDANKLELATHKTEAIVLTSKRGYRQPVFQLNGQVRTQENLCYLGVKLSKKLGFWDIPAQV